MLSKLNAAETIPDVATGGGSNIQAILMNLMPFVIIFVIFYFLLIRPQKKKQKEHQDLINNLKTGEKVLLNSGFTGSIVRIKDNGYFIIEIAKGVEVEVAKSAVVNVINKG